MCLREIRKRLACIGIWIMEMPSALISSSNFPPLPSAGGSKVSENSNGPSSVRSSNSHPFDQFEPLWLTETDTSMPTLPQFPSDREPIPLCQVFQFAFS